MIDPAQITFFIPVYERYNYFEEAVCSLLNQTVQPGKIVIVDNCSTHSRFERFVKNKNFATLEYIRNESNLGMTGNWNRCIELCDTLWMSILHDDDALHPDFLDEMIKYFTLIDQRIDVIACSAVINRTVNFGQVNNHFRIRQLKESHFLLSNLTQFPGVLIRKEILSQTNGFDYNYYPCSDMKLWLDITRRGNVFHVSKRLAFYRIADLQTTATEFVKILNKTYEIGLEILEQNDTFIGRFLLWQSIKAQFRGYLSYYRLDITSGYCRIATNDLSYEVIRDYVNNMNSKFGVMREMISSFLFKVIAKTMLLFSVRLFR